MEQLNRVYEVCIKKAERHMKMFGDELYEFNGRCMEGDYYAETEKTSFYNMFCWTTSFVTGLAPLLYQTQKDEQYLKWANSFEEEYYKKIYFHSVDTMHDIGFLYSPYSVMMYKLTGSKSHRRIALRAADELLKRFEMTGKYINAWGRMDDGSRERRAIIDCMMNIALLFWAWKETGYEIYYDVALAHAETTKKYFIREDYSVIHSVNFDAKTGNFEKENNGCGYANGSHWARGTAWAVYGFALAARYTGMRAYYDLARNIARKYISCIPVGSYIPVWDFRLPADAPAKMCGGGNKTWDETDSSNCIYNVDSSAAAIMASALIEIYCFIKDQELYDFANNTLLALTTKEYISFDTSVPGILKRQNGQMAYTMYGDYFLIEAIQKKLFDTDSCW